MKLKTAASPINLPKRERAGLRSPNAGSFVKLASRAGAMIGTSRQDDAYAELMTFDRLKDDQREKLGYATSTIARAKQAGYSPAELWNFIQTGFGARGGKPMDLFAADDVELGTLAFAAGACIEDPAITIDIQTYIKAILHGRILSIRMRNAQGY